MARSDYVPHLLVGIDYSAHSLAALGQARALAERMHVELYLVHVREPGGFEAGSRMDPPEWWLMDADISFDLLVRRGTSWVELARVATETGALALVIGSHGHSEYQPLALGSTAARIGLLAPCPVIIVNPRSSGRSPRASRADCVRPQP